ncbi:MAG: glycoside hydrolase family 3 N-terminal domain-containing protein [Bacteroidales bacterium]|nr:glycoside hydrolase family 3 N-terminal domain-containing protein [Bacteroidales bacterium]
MRKIFWCGLLLLYSFFLSAQIPKVNIYSKVDPVAMEAWADSVFDTMTLDERIGQLFMVVAEPKLNSRNMQKIERYVSELKVGGILFSKGKLEEQARVTNRCQEMSKVPLLISLDGEWGLAMRLEPVVRFPRNMMLGAIENNELISLYGKEVGRQCKEMGIQINFAPVLDVNVAPENPVIGMRSFGSDPENVMRKGLAYSKGLEETGILSVAKHFPGHGDTNDDSHYTLPVIPHDRKRLEQVELYPFRAYINERLSGIMTGHLYIPALDSGSLMPSSLSRKIVTDLLQNELGFQGICFTDALMMKGSGSTDVCVQSLLAGNDILLSPADPLKEFASVKRAVDSGYIGVDLIEAKCLKVLKLKYALGLQNYKSIELKGLAERINSSDAEWLARKLNAEAITLLKNTDRVIPLKELSKVSTASLSLGESSPSIFQDAMQRYTSIPSYSLAPKSDAKKVSEICRLLKKYDRIILGVHSSRSVIPAELEKLLATKKVTVVFFLSPYLIKRFDKIDRSAEAVILAYENTSFAQDCAAQLVFGGIPAKGKLPVDLPSYPLGAGEMTEQVRLGYNLPQEVGLSWQKLDEIDKIAREGIAERAYPGCQILVARKGVVIYQKAFGAFDYDSIRMVTLNDLYDVASVTKAVATTPALMMLYDQKKFKLNDPISQFLPVLSHTNKSDITFRDLLFHQSGLPAFIPFYRMAIDPESYKGAFFSSVKTPLYPAMVDKNYYARTDYEFKPHLCTRKQKPEYIFRVSDSLFICPAFRDSVFASIAAVPLKSKEYRYSDLNFILLGEAVSKMAEEPINEYLEQQLYAPLGASRTLYLPLSKFSVECIIPTEEDRFLRKQLLQGYVNDESAAFLGGVAGNAGLFSNANDLAKISQMYLNGGTYGGETYVAKETCRLFTQAKSPVSRRGLGFDKPDVLSPKKSPVPNGLPGSVYGHTGFTGTCFWIDPDNELIYIFLSNRVYPTRTNKKLTQMNIRGRIHQAIYNAIE